MLKIDCYTLFDITTTGVSNQHRGTVFPLTTLTGKTIDDAKALSFARNQQRNYDTLLQLIGMRTQIFDPSPAALSTEERPVFQEHKHVWTFSFFIEPQSQWSVDGDDFWLLKNDSDGTPMLLGLEESAKIDPYIKTQGVGTNVEFYAQKTK